MCKGKREHKIVMKKFDLNSICGRKVYSQQPQANIVGLFISPVGLVDGL